MHLLIYLLYQSDQSVSSTRLSNVLINVSNIIALNQIDFFFSNFDFVMYLRIVTNI